MHQVECNDLRDILFEECFVGEWKENKFRYLAVIAGKSTKKATLYFAYAKPVWARANVATDSGSVESEIRYLVSKTKYANYDISIVYRDYLRGQWDLPWGLTAKAKHDNMPSFILVEREDGAVDGVIMRDSNMSHNHHQFESDNAEMHEVDRAIISLRALKKDQKYFSWYKDCNISANSLEEALRTDKIESVEQKHVLIYRDNEWLSGYHNTFDGKDDLNLYSVADTNPIRVSETKRSTRPGLEILKGKKFLKGDYAVLEKAMSITYGGKGLKFGDYENCPGVIELCKWWNENAKEEFRHASTFRVYIWSEDEKVFVAGDPEEPSFGPHQLASDEVTAVFREKNKPLVMVSFMKGRSSNVSDGMGTLTYYVNGDPGYDIGCGLDEVDEALYASIGLRTLANC